MAGKWLPAAELTGSGRPVLHTGEVECSLLSSVDLECEENPNFPLFKSGLLIVTTHRLLWIPASSTAAFAIPLAAVSHIFSSSSSAKKSMIKTMFASPRVRIQVSATPEGRVEEGGSRSVVITLVLRGKSDQSDSFSGKLWEAWRGRAWESAGDSGSSSGVGGGVGGGGGVMSVRMPVVGVSGILRKEQEMWESTDKSLQDAFQDLNALMSKAKEMVMLAEKMRLKLLSGSNNQASAANDEEMGSKEEMQDWLLSVGIASPVTKESAGALYHQQLSRQLADFVKVPIERAGGMVNLIDIYCLFNRARGTELISPEDLLQACSLWEKFDVPVMLRKFDSGVMVIQSKSYRDEEVLLRIKSLVLKPDALRTGISASDAAITLGIAPAMAKEHLLTAETKGLLCRDVSPDGFRFYVNLFQEIVLDDLFLVKDHGTYSAWVSAAVASR
ncbi:Vacuolar protein sorting-associated protein [Actinidia chinensis var. chinensis]|uniref:Vacuolar protein-sorting-associated protein 36 n=1 Tax=Actinidia chinensis var. chinensis TaxID=1590841 RepID=A0A2R6R1D7_ACTCC|nr:Vacuolar protein sorting-associated protein [Actinidia chinensis var. chinensis]